MRQRTVREWSMLYESMWRRPFAHLSKLDRAKLVRACKGKDVYDSHDEAEAAIAALPLRPGYLLGSYDCPLCAGIHLGNRKYLRFESARILGLQKTGAGNRVGGRRRAGIVIGVANVKNLGNYVFNSPATSTLARRY
jgi:hypothetical protein